MTVSLKHQFVSNVADSPDATLVQPSNWNAEHTLTANADSLLGAVTAGNVVEVTCTSAGRALLDDADASAQRTTLGLGTIATQNSNAVSITGGTIVANASGVSIRDADASNVMTIAVGSNLTANTTLTLTTGASSNRTLDISATNVTVSVAGAALIDDADASAQRTTLGLGTVATQNANNVSITGGSITGITDLAVADGGTGASDAATARTNLGIGTLGTQNANAVAITGGTIVANASGISIRDADASNVMTIAVGSNLTANTTLTLTTGATTNRTLDISATNVTVSVAGAALIDDADAAAQRTTLGLGTISTQNSNNVSITGGSITGITDLAVADGGTGASDAATARTNLGIGTIATQNANNVSITGGSITGITDLAVADGGTGASDAATARTNLGIGTIATQNANNVSITGGSITGITDLAVADGGTGASDAATARTNLGIGTMGTQNANAVAITGGTIVANASGISIRDADASNVMTIAVGSNLTANTTLTLTTGATTSRTLDISATNVTVSVAGAALIDDADAAAQRTTLGLGTIATQNANNVSITGGSVTGITDLAVADGGTGASDAATARTNLGLGTMSTQNANNVSITGGSVTGIADLAVADGGTGASDAATARTNLGIGTIATQNSNNVSITGGSITGITDLAVADGGTGVASFTAYSVILGGTTSTGALQNVSGVGTSGQVLTSGGANVIPSWTTVQGVTATTGSAPYYGARAWVNFNGTANSNVSGTYSQSGTTVTVTITAHGLSVGNIISIDITSGTAADSDSRVVATVPTANTFTYTAINSLTTSGNCTLLRNTIRGSKNVSSVSDNATGSYTVNFITVMADANYCIVANAKTTNSTNANTTIAQWNDVNTGGFRLASSQGNNATLVDAENMSAAVFS